MTWDAAIGPGARTGATLAAFLAAALWLARATERCGLAGRLADGLLHAARGRSAGLYAAVCATAAGLTGLLSLDGAVVVLAPALRDLDRRGLDVRPLLLATIGVTNAFSMALPQGNPANLLVMSGLDLSPGGYVGTMLVPGLAATLICAGAAAAHERGRIRGDIPRPAARPPLTGPESRALAALAAAGAGELAAPLLGVAPWWPLCAVAALHWAATGRTLTGVRVPWKLAGGVGLATAALAGTTTLAGLGRLPAPATAGRLVAAALAVGALAAATNNLPVGAALGRLLPGPLAYAAVVGLSTGALATRRGSLATILALDLAGEAGASAGRGYRRVWAPTALAATVVAAGLVAVTAR